MLKIAPGALYAFHVGKRDALLFTFQPPRAARDFLGPSARERFQRVEVFPRNQPRE